MRPSPLVAATETGGSLAASGSPASTRPDAASSTVAGAPLAVVLAATRTIGFIRGAHWAGVIAPP